MEHGLPFSVNSDDASIMRTELYQDYQALVEKFGVEHKMLRQTVSLWEVEEVVVVQLVLRMPGCSNRV